MVVKICVVCGDKGRARNFGAFTCESCKSFFRRYGLKEQQLICPSNGKCDINVMTRRMCRNCRLKKCFAVGLKKELIRSDEENHFRKELIKENKLKHKLSDESNNCIDFSVNNSDIDSMFSDTTIDDNFTFNLLDNNSLTISDIEKDLNGFNNICADDKYALMRYGARDQVLIRSLKYYYKEIDDMSDKNFTKICDICLDKARARNFGAITCESCKAFFRRNGLKTEQFICPSNGKCDINVMTRRMCRKCSLNGFNNICADDKYALMKYGTRDLVLIRSLRHYNRETESFITPIDHDHSLQIGLALYEKSALTNVFKAYFEKFLSIWNYNDHIIIDL
ncbi:unnamed protein product, partial [Medioppia subpectinata]